MICNKCSIKAICKVFEVINNNPEIDITVNNCGHKNKTSFKELTSEATCILKPISSEPEKIEEVRVPRMCQDFSELSRKNQMEKDKNNNPISDIIDKEITEEDLSECDCGNLSAAITNCPICSKKMCEACSMISVNDITGNTQLICEECWSTDKDKEVKPKSKKRGRPKKQEVINVL